jgi:hypothetical protein
MNNKIVLLNWKNKEKFLEFCLDEGYGLPFKLIVLISFHIELIFDKNVDNFLFIVVFGHGFLSTN